MCKRCAGSSSAFCILGRPTYMSADLGFTAILSSSVFARYPQSSPNGTQPKSATCSEVNAMWKYMSEMWGIPSPCKLGAQKPLFQRLHNITATSTAYIVGKKHDIDNRVSALATRKGLLHRLRTTWTLVYKRLLIGPSFLPTLPKFCILIRCQASQTEISKRNLTKLSQTVDSKSR